MTTIKKITVLILTVAVFIFPISELNKVEAQIPFSGRIAMMMPVCVDPSGTLITLYTLGPLAGGFSTGATMNFMYLPETKIFQWGPPTHPGQWLLGMATAPVACMVPCGPSLCPIGFGFTILFHGSSLS